MLCKYYDVENILLSILKCVACGDSNWFGHKAGWKSHGWTRGKEMILLRWTAWAETVRKKGYGCRVEQSQEAQADTGVWLVAWPAETKSSVSQLSGLPFFLNNRTLSFFNLICYFEIISNYGEFQLPCRQLPDHFYPDSPTVNIWEQACRPGVSSPSALWCVFPKKQGNSPISSRFNPLSQETIDVLLQSGQQSPFRFHQLSKQVSVFLSWSKIQVRDTYCIQLSYLSNFLYSRTFPSSFPVFQVLSWKRPGLSFCRLSLSLSLSSVSSWPDSGPAFFVKMP